MSDRPHDKDRCSSVRDALSNYDPPTYDDQLEQALMEETVGAIRTQPCTAISPDTSIQDALHTLVGREIACLLVAEDDQLVGVFTKRDVLDKVVLRYDEVKDHPVSEMMTRNPVYVYETDPVAAALCVMAVGGHRHVPVLDNENKIAGVVGPRRVTTFLSRYFPGATDDGDAAGS